MVPRTSSNPFSSSRYEPPIPSSPSTRTKLSGIDLESSSHEAERACRMSQYARSQYARYGYEFGEDPCAIPSWSPACACWSPIHSSRWLFRREMERGGVVGAASSSVGVGDWTMIGIAVKRRRGLLLFSIVTYELQLAWGRSLK